MFSQLLLPNTVEFLLIGWFLYALVAKISIDGHADKKWEQSSGKP